RAAHYAAALEAAIDATFKVETLGQRDTLDPHAEETCYVYATRTLYRWDGTTWGAVSQATPTLDATGRVQETVRHLGPGIRVAAADAAELQDDLRAGLAWVQAKDYDLRALPDQTLDVPDGRTLAALGSLATFHGGTIRVAGQAGGRVPLAVGSQPGADHIMLARGQRLVGAGDTVVVRQGASRDAEQGSREYNNARRAPPQEMATVEAVEVHGGYDRVFLDRSLRHAYPVMGFVEPAQVHVVTPREDVAIEGVRLRATSLDLGVARRLKLALTSEGDALRFSERLAQAGPIALQDLTLDFSFGATRQSRSGPANALLLVGVCGESRLTLRFSGGRKDHVDLQGSSGFTLDLHSDRCPNRPLALYACADFTVERAVLTASQIGNEAGRNIEAALFDFCERGTVRLLSIVNKYKGDGLELRGACRDLDVQKLVVHMDPTVPQGANHLVNLHCWAEGGAERVAIRDFHLRGGRKQLALAERAADVRFEDGLMEHLPGGVGTNTDLGDKLLADVERLAFRRVRFDRGASGGPALLVNDQDDTGFRFKDLVVDECSATGGGRKPSVNIADVDGLTLREWGGTSSGDVRVQRATGVSYRSGRDAAVRRVVLRDAELAAPVRSNARQVVEG
ncbi:MAG: hypothetical protein AAGF99_10060, partial [Bacteroidota bacterium]